MIEHLHHDFALGPDGRTYALGHEIRTEPRKDLAPVEAPFFDEFLVILSPDGHILERISIFEAFGRSLYRNALLELADLDNPKGDYLHPNAVELVDERIAAQVPGWQAGQVLVSLLEMDGLALIDPEAREVVWFMRGAWHYAARPGPAAGRPHLAVRQPGRPRRGHALADPRDRSGLRIGRLAVRVGRCRSILLEVRWAASRRSTMATSSSPNH